MKKPFLMTIMVMAMMNLRSESSQYDTITLGAGCFWCVEAVMQQLNGIQSVTSGYSGGKIANPTYREVSSGLTGHAEVVQLVYDPKVVTLAQLLEVFFKTHDPTTLNRQGADVGTQYRSVVFYHNEEQKAQTEKIITLLEKEKIWNQPIVTEISPYKNFYKAESYHQDYYDQNQNQPYCRFVIVPKLEKFNKLFSDLKKKSE